MISGYIYVTGYLHMAQQKCVTFYSFLSYAFELGLILGSFNWSKIVLVLE